MPDQEEDLSLLEMLDHLLDRGVVIAGEAVISIGDVDLLYLGLNVVLANVDAVMRVSSGKTRGSSGPRFLGSSGVSGDRTPEDPRTRGSEDPS
jgi:hypothetical protein